MTEPDLVIVGGGIAGCSLATVMARAGAGVLVLERQSEYRDHVRGEILWPWGVRVARLLGLEEPLLDGGAQVIRWFDLYDEGTSEPTREDAGTALRGIDGSLNIGHPSACVALAQAATSAGADVRAAAREVRVTSEASPSVEWLEPDGTRRQMRCRLIVGADGRRSSVRAQVGAEFEVDEPAHLIAGMLVRANEGMLENVNLQAREADLIFFSFPQGDGLARMYLCFPTDDRARFAGPDGQRKFLQECDLNCLDGFVDWSQARPAGPCATFAGENSRAPRPAADGVVLIGDAAGYENPVQGQGLSMALQDVHDVSSALISGGSIAEELESYTMKRAIRQRLANLGVALEVWANEGFAIQDPAVRAARYEHIRGDEVLAALEACFMTGFDTLPQDLTRADLNDKLSAVA